LIWNCGTDAAVFFFRSKFFFGAAFVFNFSFAPFAFFYLFFYTTGVMKFALCKQGIFGRKWQHAKETKTFPLACNSRVQNLAADSDALERNIKAN
jgi:hypothetical protein